MNWIFAENGTFFKEKDSSITIGNATVFFFIFRIAASLYKSS